MRRFFLILSTLCLLAVQVGQGPAYEMSPDQKLSLPDYESYRKWSYSGCAVVPNEKNNLKAIFPGVHQVFIDPASLKHRQEKGVFPDGTIILMEVSQMNFKESESGFGYFANGGREILAQVKDRRRFPNEGWAYYYFSDKEIKAGTKVKAPEPSPKCQACHTAAAEEDEVFVQYYPSLKPKP